MPRGNKPKHYDQHLVSEVAAKYSQGMTQAEIGVAVGLSQKVIWNIMRRNGLVARTAAKRNQLGANNSSWKGEHAGKSAFHKRLYALHGKPSKCTQCGTADPARSYDYANLTGHYEDLLDYAAMCRSCHWKYDRKIYNIKRMRRNADGQA